LTLTRVTGSPVFNLTKVELDANANPFTITSPKYFDDQEDAFGGCFEGERGMGVSSNSITSTGTCSLRVVELVDAIGIDWGAGREREGGGGGESS